MDLCALEVPYFFYFCMIDQDFLHLDLMKHKLGEFKWKRQDLREMKAIHQRAIH